MPWLDAFTHDPRDYERLQWQRPDYRGGIEALREMSRRIVQDKPDASVLDVCGGTAEGSIGLCALHNVREITVVDADPKLLEVAAKKSEKIKTVATRIQDYDSGKKHDLVIAAYAYHHLPDKEKPALCRKLAASLKDHGDMLVLEICGKRGPEIESYYNEVIARSPGGEELTGFLKWLSSRDTAKNGEFKVPLSRVLEDFKKAGMAATEVKRVWTGSKPGVGTFLIRLKKDNKSA